ncbi:hypothetical protein [Rubripirellula reticaptiva]|uniref:Uncharacterized protein n=1 Tax=Rubripirellula reticaptiva TaxID=2528013 RepID=A0A5C6F3S7_9BACT|nr:hypothetical protein [Rubripirellula reticaptiva]TWU56008.1 hypothetical protein Poly59_23110 [Rubripirellula reticaptiva]
MMDAQKYWNDLIAVRRLADYESIESLATDLLACLDAGDAPPSTLASLDRDDSLNGPIAKFVATEFKRDASLCLLQPETASHPTASSGTQPLAESQTRWEAMLAAWSREGGLEDAAETADSLLLDLHDGMAPPYSLTAVPFNDAIQGQLAQWVCQLILLTRDGERDGESRAAIESV